MHSSLTHLFIYSSNCVGVLILELSFVVFSRIILPACSRRDLCENQLIENKEASETSRDELSTRSVTLYASDSHTFSLGLRNDMTKFPPPNLMVIIIPGSVTKNW